MHAQHLQIVFNKQNKAESVYAIPSSGLPKGKGSGREFMVFQLVALHPDRRSYLQRTFALSHDDSLSLMNCECSF